MPELEHKINGYKHVKVVGLITNKLYVKGTEEYCFRYLKDKYPGKRSENMKRSDVAQCYPEPLQILEYKPRKGKKHGN
ncbi:hypothetical protein [Oceanobacillus sp. J11TS1]|uniref:hypothetical protein n=1 Tax=Oceanobacillus sp. J11TS1 TaxID=2807191 RepID=UPI001B08A719|nr:hypothetical protein [Oceanobacillus sp. J11TS1]GIO22460.1 hypothetical protein J11TS1_10410 [Oceanobacillus sp. J11TS1]